MRLNGRLSRWLGLIIRWVPFCLVRYLCDLLTYCNPFMFLEKYWPQQSLMAGSSIRYCLGYWRNCLHMYRTMLTRDPSRGGRSARHLLLPLLPSTCSTRITVLPNSCLTFHSRFRGCRFHTTVNLLV